MRQPKNDKVEFANTLRGFAALAVVISHYFGVFWLRPDLVANLINAPELPAVANRVPIYVHWLNAVPVFNWGGYGVALFFLISGFVIPFSLRRLNWTGFCVNRLFRIVPTYAVGFTITLTALWICTEFYAEEWPYKTRPILIHYLPGLRDLFRTRNIDGVIWTLEIEMKFYVLCAVLSAWFRRGSLNVFLVPLGLFLLDLWLSRNLNHWAATAPFAFRISMPTIFSTQHIIFMFIGVSFHYLYLGRFSQRTAGLLASGLFALFCIQWRTGPHHASFPVALSYACALVTFAAAYAWPAIFRANPISDFLADISYPLYVIHGVTGYVALRLLLGAGLGSSLSLAIVSAACISLASLLHRLVEAPSQSLGKRLADRIQTQGTFAEVVPQS